MGDCQKPGECFNYFVQVWLGHKHTGVPGVVNALYGNETDRTFSNNRANIIGGISLLVDICWSRAGLTDHAWADIH